MPFDEITMTEGTFATHEVDEWFPGNLDRVEEGEDYGFGPTIRFVLTLDGEDSETWALASQKLSPRSKLYNWIKGIDPKLVPEIGQVVQWDQLVDRRVDVMFELANDKERVSKIRSSKTAAAKPASDVKTKQAQAAKAKTAYKDDESPF